ncbi:MAG: chromosome segregation protein SMC, partial [Synergistales bacterium]|nr:chromosome segregation protein SMC [Synergistales bacterium]
MKILKVRFKNLNSLFGDWEIDLSSFGCEGIFAITGPTGSGKTTVLDAICLGLYGRTPRLSNVTKSGNEIMSRNTGECSAEVEFETQKGRFRCHWSQHRARKSPEGDLQQPKHEISDCDSGQILESKIKEVADRIEMVTGMDFDRFTRSMLLAQGGFSAFLQASPSERAPILEQITGTKVYSDISVAVHERHRKEKETLERLRAEMAGSTVMDREREKAVEEELGKAKNEELELTSEAKSLNLSLSWLNGLEVLKGEIASLNDEIEELQAEKESFRPHRDRLNLALSAASLEAPYLQIEELRGQQRSDEKSLSEKNEALPELERSLEDQIQRLKKAEQKTCNRREALKNSIPKLKQVRSLDQTIASLKKQIEDLEDGCRGIEAKIQSHGQAKIAQEADRSKAQENLKAIDKYLSDNARDRWLIGGLAGLEAQLAELSTRKKDIDEKASQRDKAETSLREAVHRLEALKEDLTLKKRDQEDSAKDLQQTKDLLTRTLGDKLLREYRVEKESLLKEAAYIAKIASLEKHRERLEDGVPCPLCGSTEHPFAEGNVPVSDEIDGRIKELTDLIERVECLESEIKGLEDLKDKADRALGNLEKNEQILSIDVKSSQKTLAQLEEEIEKLGSDFQRRKDTLSKDLIPLGVDLTEESLPSLLDSLRDRLKSWELHQAKKEELKGMIAMVEGEIKKLEALTEREKSSLELEMERLKAQQGDLSSVDGDRKKLYGDGDPDREEETLNDGISKAEEIERRERSLHDDLFLKRDRAFNEIEAL